MGVRLGGERPRVGGVSKRQGRRDGLKEVGWTIEVSTAVTAGPEALWPRLPTRDAMQSEAADGSLARRWRSLSAAKRRRIVLGSLVAVSLAARDAVLLLGAAALFAMGELAPRPARAPTAG